ncbi:hypothetical protein OSB04_021321 [Centaurea solstitialis]|uniref:Uncharacterized protein n=1 Tax=Centaurea solstitialis TaxID=347529 RepID=A0AA38T1N9_9ASTR|nr:hypothetical protein OSB04_021321 [Centaurea solstitialis]
MENVDVEHGGADPNSYNTQETIDSILCCVENQNATKQGRSSIKKVHSSFRNLCARSFNPQVVSIGPLHKNNINVQAFNGKKATYLSSLLSRLETKSLQEQILEECVKKVEESIEKIKKCYEGISDYGTDTAFVKMMVMDACFILEFAYQISKSFMGKMSQSQAISVSYDLVLLENQIPFFVLDDIFQCTILQIDPQQTIIELIGKLLSRINLFEGDLSTIHNSKEPAHILELLHTCYKPHHNIPSTTSNLVMHSVVELDRAGVSFRPNQNTKWPMEMKVELHKFPWYLGKPTLRMPVLRIHHFTESVLRNLIAYEQSSRVVNYITSYAMAMDMLVNTQEDIAKLVQSKVLVANLSSNEEAANMMNNICKQVPWEHFFYDEEWKLLDSYYNSWLPKNYARFKRTYFNSPWKIVALFAGIVLFVLTVVQTIFTIKSAH